MQRTKIAIERDPVTRQVSICISGWWKWIIGFVGSAMVTAMTAGTGALWALAMGQASLSTEVRSIGERVERNWADNRDRLDRIEDKVDREISLQRSAKRGMEQ